MTMPKSKVRKKSLYTVPTNYAGPTNYPGPANQLGGVKVRVAGPSHPFYVAVMLGLMVLGLLWLVVNYLAVDKIPVLSGLGNWNFAIGFALMISGLLMTMGWR
jgi:hypothetical protein